jgi:hypothetical protein
MNAKLTEDPVTVGTIQHSTHPAVAGVFDDDFREALRAEDREEELRCRSDVEGGEVEDEFWDDEPEDEEVEDELCD